MQLFFFRFLPHVGYRRVQSRAPRAEPQVFLNHPMPPGAYWDLNNFSVFLQPLLYRPVHEDSCSLPWPRGGLNLKALEQPRQCLPTGACFVNFPKVGYWTVIYSVLQVFPFDPPHPPTPRLGHTCSPGRRPWSGWEHFGNFRLRADLGWYHRWTLQSVKRLLVFLPWCGFQV